MICSALQVPGAETEVLRDQDAPVPYGFAENGIVGGASQSDFGDRRCPDVASDEGHCQRPREILVDEEEGHYPLVRIVSPLRVSAA